jgi:hypothetical protein
VGTEREKNLPRPSRAKRGEGEEEANSTGARDSRTSSGVAADIENVRAGRGRGRGGAKCRRAVMESRSGQSVGKRFEGEREREREGERKKCVDDSSVSKVVEFLRDAIRSFAAPLRYAFRREDSPPRLAATRNNNSAAAAF